MARQIWGYTIMDHETVRTNKGVTIRDLVSQGLTNDEILTKVDTTVNSVRWHRSKMRGA